MALPHEGVIKVSGVRKKIQIFLSGLPCKPSPAIVPSNIACIFLEFKRKQAWLVNITCKSRNDLFWLETRSDNSEHNNNKMQLFLNKIFCQLESRWDRIVAGDCPPEGAGQQREQGGDGFQDHGQVGFKADWLLQICSVNRQIPSSLTY